VSDPRGPAAQRPRRFVVDAPLAWAIVGAAVIALIVALAILLTRPAPVEAPGPSGTPGTSQAASGPAAPARPTRLADGTWWRVDWRDATDVAHPDEMRVGRLDGTLTTSLVLPPARQIQRGFGPPLVRGPAGGVVLVATAVGETVSLKRIDARSGADSLLAVVRGQVPDATLAADGRHVYYLLLSERGLSAVRLATDGSGETVTVAAPRAPAARADGIVLAAAIQPTATIAVSSDERTLVIGDCFMSCTARVVDLASGGERAISGLDPTSTFTGWTQTGVWLGEQCLDPSTGVVTNRPCLGEPPQQFDVNFRFGLEVPAGWRVEMQRVPGQNQMSFLLRAVAIAPDGTQTILDGLGIFSGNG
jgi:hypothetical protein